MAVKMAGTSEYRSAIVVGGIVQHAFVSAATSKDTRSVAQAAKAGAAAGLPGTSPTGGGATGAAGAVVVVGVRVVVVVVSVVGGDGSSVRIPVRPSSSHAVIANVMASATAPTAARPADFIRSYAPFATF